MINSICSRKFISRKVYLVPKLSRATHDKMIGFKNSFRDNSWVTAFQLVQMSIFLNFLTSYLSMMMMKVDICSRSEHEPHSWHLWNATDGFFSRSDGCRQNMWAIATNFRHEQWENWGNRRFLWFNALHQSRCNWNIIQLLLDGSDCWLNCFLPRSDERAGEETLPSDEEWVWF